VDTEPNEVKVGQAVEIIFEELSDEITLPRFRRASA
jgi:hypothetical protein